jgi:hypothetical protein
VRGGGGLQACRRSPADRRGCHPFPC